MDVKQYFKDYPGSDKCFQTSDGLIFHEEGDARLHAQSLGKKGVDTFTNVADEEAEVLEEPAAPEEPVEPAAPEEPAAPAGASKPKSKSQKKS